jgi:hypothetical protein
MTSGHAIWEPGLALDMSNHKLPRSMSNHTPCSSTGTGKFNFGQSLGIRTPPTKLYEQTTCTLRVRRRGVYAGGPLIPSPLHPNEARECAGFLPYQAHSNSGWLRKNGCGASPSRNPHTITCLATPYHADSRAVRGQSTFTRNRTLRQQAGVSGPLPIDAA